jgi:dynein heavy chain
MQRCACRPSQVTVSLQSVDVVVQPPMAEVHKALGRLVRSLVEATKAFVRWMDCTCIETPEQRGASEDDEPIVFTFYWDVAANPQVCCGPASALCAASTESYM